MVVAPAEECRSAEIDVEAVRSEYQRALDGGMDRRGALRAAAQRLGIRRRQVFDILAAGFESDSE